MTELEGKLRLFKGKEPILLPRGAVVVVDPVLEGIRMPLPPPFTCTTELDGNTAG